MVKKNDDPKSGMYRDFGDEIAHALSLYERKKKDAPKGVNLVKQVVSNKHYLLLRFTDPTTGKRIQKKCGEDFTEKGIIAAIAKAHKVAAALKTITPNEFWSWYDREILDKNEKVELLTYRQIFADIEDEYYSGNHKNVKEQKRTKNIASFEGSFDRTYGVVFRKFPDWDIVPTWDEMLTAWRSWEQGTKSFKDAKTAITAICKRLPSSDELLKRIDKVRSKQTKFKEGQSIDLNTYLAWYESALQLAPKIKHRGHRESRLKWLWASAMNVMYGLRPSEVAAILNLTEPFTIDGTTLYPLTDAERNPKGVIVIGEYTHFGTTTKTGSRPISPVPDKELMERLRIREVHKLTYTPKPGSKARSIVGGFSNIYRARIASAKCPVTETYAFRHLYNYLCELHGVPLEQRSADMGHDPDTNQRKYKARRNFKDKLELTQYRKPQPLPYDRVIAKLEELGVDTSLPDVKLILRVIYQLD